MRLPFRRRPAPTFEDIAAEALARSKASTEARIAELRAQRHQKALLNIMEGVIQDGIRPAEHRRSGDA